MVPPIKKTKWILLKKLLQKIKAVLLKQQAAINWLCPYFL
jgi:hypothetical protein